MSILRPAKCKYNGVMLRDVTIQTSAHLTNLGMVLNQNVKRNASKFAMFWNERENPKILLSF